MSIECEQPFCITVQDNPCTISGNFSFTIAPQCGDKSQSIVTISGTTSGIVTDVSYVISLDSGGTAADAIDLIVGDGTPNPDVVLPGVNPGPRMFHATPDRPFIGKISMVVSGLTGCPTFILRKPISIISDVGTYASLNTDTGIFLGVVPSLHNGTDTWRIIEAFVGFGPALFYDTFLDKISSAFIGAGGRPKDNWQFYVDLLERVGTISGPIDFRRWFAIYEKTPWPGCDTPKGTYNLVTAQFDHSGVPDFSEAAWLAAYPSLATPAASITVT